MATYPLAVQYCGVCGLTPELCVYDAKKFPQCRPWLEKHAPQHVPDLAAAVGGLSLGGGGGGAEGAGSGASGGGGSGGSSGGGGGGGGGSSGGGGAAAEGAAAAAGGAAAAAAAGGGGGGAAPAAKKAAAPAKPKVTVQVREEGKRTTTAICGLDPFCAKLKEAASALAKKVGAGATVRPHPANPNISEVVVQVRQAAVPFAATAPRPSPPPRSPAHPTANLPCVAPPVASSLPAGRHYRLPGYCRPSRGAV